MKIKLISICLVLLLSMYCGDENDNSDKNDILQKDQNSQVLYAEEVEVDIVEFDQQDALYTEEIEFDIDELDQQDALFAEEVEVDIDELDQQDALYVEEFKETVEEKVSQAIIEFTYVPEYGNDSNDLQGKVLNVNPDEYKVAVFIYVYGWWTKPYWDNPLTIIQPDGTWTCDITTGKNDKNAAQIMAFLLPNGISPPLMKGDLTLPPELFQNSVANVQVIRKEDEIITSVKFSSYDWIVKNSYNTKVGPGPNYFSNSENNVWIDQDGQLHLKITYKDGKWYCAEVYSKESFGYGKYIFYLSSRVDLINENVVVGLFTWDDENDYNHREIDIEFSRWSQINNENSQFVVQPFDVSDNLYRFKTELTSDYSTHGFNWQQDKISFQSIYGHYATPPDESYIIDTWDYTKKWDSEAKIGIPEPDKEKARINLWLNEGTAPSDNKEIEIVIHKFEFIPFTF